MGVKLYLKRINWAFEPISVFVGNELAIISYNTSVTKIRFLDSARFSP